MANKTPKVRTAPPTDKELVKLFNKTERSFMHELKLEDGTVLKYTLPPGAFAKVAPEVAELWLGMFPNEISTDAEAKQLVNAAEAKAADLEKHLATVTAELAALKAKSDPKGELAKAQAKIAALEADLEKATAPAATTSDASSQV